MSQTQPAQVDSIEAQDPNSEEVKKQKSRRPANTAFRQQRLKAWQPILTPKTVLPLFFAVGIIFAPIGGLLLWASSQVEEISIDYSACSTIAQSDDFVDIPSGKVSSYFKTSNYTGSSPTWKRTPMTVTWPLNPGSVDVNTSVCSLQFDITHDIGPPVLFFYRLTNFYQNHRRYVKSEDMDQLMGEARDNKTIDGSDCDPLTLSPQGVAYYPCGLIANSQFNDTFQRPVLTNPRGASDQNVTYNMTDKGIAWDSDKDLYKATKYTNGSVVPPPNWAKRYPNGYTDDQPFPNLHDNEPFQVWMRTAGLPTFSKLALRNDNETMSSGRYQVDIWDEFPVTVYGGTKSILISTRTVMGGKNPFLGIAYIVVGGLCILLGALFTATHLIRPRKLGDHTYLTWNNEPTAAQATGRSAHAAAH